MMSRIYKIFIFLLTINTIACVSDYTNINTVNGEDEDIGLGGTGLLANTGIGLGGTGIRGEVTGFGSVFINGIEVEYSNKTPFTIDGIKAMPQQLKVGDVIEVLTTDANSHTHAQLINLRHEVIGRVESVNPKTSSFIVEGQTVTQKSDKGSLPNVGAIVAVSGIRIDQQTIMSTRVSSANIKQTLLKTHTELPFKQHATRWSIQMKIRNGAASIQLDDGRQIIVENKKLTESLKGVSAIKILELHKSRTGLLKLDNVISPLNIPRGQASPANKQKHDIKRMQRSISIQPRTNRSAR